MQIFLLSNRSTASGNGIGSAPTAVRYKTSAAGPGPVTDDAEGRAAVGLARAAVARALGLATPGTNGPLPRSFRERRGVFVTWYAVPGHDLRGCVGFPRPVRPLADGIPEAAVAAALEDPRFPAIRPEELGHLVAEVSLLGPFESVPLADRPGGIRVGRDGLAIDRGTAHGLLLPQVATELGWGPEEFLDGLCEKAGLRRGSWRQVEATIYRFSAERYFERSPGGEIDHAEAGRRPPSGT